MMRTRILPVIPARIRASRLIPAAAAGSAAGFGLVLMLARNPGRPRLAIGLVVLYLACWGLVVTRSRESARFWGVRFVACTAAILFGFGLFELPALFRLIDYRTLFASESPPWDRPDNRPDPGLISIKKGHRRVRQSFLGSEVPFLRDLEPRPIYRTDRQYDGDGFRNPRDIDRADVVLIGDSFIEGAQVTEDELITARLAAELGGGKTVVNLGQAGYGPEHELRVLREYGVPRRPSVCVWSFYEGNDLADIDEYKDQLGKLAASLGTGWGLGLNILERAFTANALGFALRTWVAPSPRRPAGRHRGWFETDRGERIPFYFVNGDYRREPASTEKSARQLDRFREILREAHALCRDDGIRLVVAFIPTKLRVYRGSCTFEEGSVSAKWPVDDLPRVIGDLVAGIPDLDYLDLTPRFQAEAAKGAVLYLPDDTHWSAAGHRSSARAIAEHLRR